jgi:threonylcarbamoyladenosine tRNA methylthiotransferase MtaB
VEQYRALVDNIVDQLPYASIGSDIIVGFPGETEEEFAESVRYLENSPLSHAHVFPYSDRPGTSASSMSGKVDGETIRRRGAILREIGARLTRRFGESHVGTVRPGLTLDDGTLVVTDNYLKVRIPAGVRRNERVRVRLTSLHSGILVPA